MPIQAKSWLLDGVHPRFVILDRQYGPLVGDLGREHVSAEGMWNQQNENATESERKKPGAFIKDSFSQVCSNLAWFIPMLYNSDSSTIKLALSNMPSFMTSCLSIQSATPDSAQDCLIHPAASRQKFCKPRTPNWAITEVFVSFWKRISKVVRVLRLQCWSKFSQV